MIVYGGERVFAGGADIAVMAEAGYAESQVVSWYIYLVPSATPKPVVARLNAEFAKALADPEVIARSSNAASGASDPVPP